MDWSILSIIIIILIVIIFVRNIDIVVVVIIVIVIIVLIRNMSLSNTTYETFCDDVEVNSHCYPTRCSGFAGGWGSQKFVDGKAACSGLTSGRKMGGFGGGVRSGGMFADYRGKENFEVVAGTFIPRGQNPILSMPGELVVSTNEYPTIPYHTYNYKPTDQYVTDAHANNINNNKDINANSPLTRHGNNTLYETMKRAPEYVDYARILYEN